MPRLGFLRARATQSDAPGGGGGTTLFASDWSAGGIGQTQTIVRDNNKWQEFGGTLVGDGGGAPQLSEVVSSSGLGFPAGIGQVYRNCYNFDSSSQVRGSDIWALPAVGDFFTIRYYFRFDIPDAAGSLSWAAHHPFEAFPGACAFEWEHRMSSNANGTYDWMLTLGNLDSSSHGGANADWVRVLNKGTVYRIETQFTHASTGVWSPRVRIYDSDDTTLLSEPVRRNQVTLLSADDPLFSPGDTCMRSVTCGTNGPSGVWADLGNSAFIYYGAVKVTLNDWCGPYVAGEAD
jgi:hypothetical protein